MLATLFVRGDSVAEDLVLGFARDSNSRGGILLFDVQKVMGRVIAIPAVICNNFDFLLRH